MLQVPDKLTKQLLDLANDIERSSNFNMKKWNCCIAGHVAARHGFPVTERIKHDAAEALGIGPATAQQLFCPPNPTHSFYSTHSMIRNVTKEQAARCLRHLAVTGEVDWDIACAEVI